MECSSIPLTDRTRVMLRKSKKEQITYSPHRYAMP